MPINIWFYKNDYSSYEGALTLRKNLFGWMVWFLGAMFFFSEYLARLAPSVMVPQIMQHFHIQALGVGALTAFFYWPYIAMQIPVGAIVDRFGPKRILAIMALLCGASCFIFALSQHLYQAEFARFLTGITSAFAFVGTLKLAALWLPATHFGMLAGATQAMGMLGASVGEGPVAYSVGQLGWQNTLYLIGFILIGIGLLISLLKTRSQQRVEVHNKISMLDGIIVVMRNPQSWLNGLYAGLIFAPTEAFAELWGVEYLKYTHSIGVQKAAWSISLIFMGWAIGGTLAGYLSDKLGERIGVMRISAILSAVTLAMILYFPVSYFSLNIIMFMFGLFNTGLGVSYALSSEINPEEYSGISMAFANMASVIVGAVFQLIIGWLLDLSWNGHMVNHIPVYTATQYEHALISLPITLVVAFVATFFIKETYCKRVHL